ncbi:glutathione S-transferase N-terminal domain-containing protein [Novosphingobium pentaromativorans]|uniref:Glutathione S-transferase n=1 Tax=Novosphingobium pentaromativorans US6-1 TaxID=1088721 RepID=G6E867_9SPHN|nr:glutathione S-transferase N-terminal domain-containing protein [Novosphingobium pentaromativorans]EHJ62407.1 Glutathione S-transferase [Novosphingobium pentaromativorans US6-1]
MFDLYIERTPAVFKCAVMLEECGYDYNCTHISVTRGDQHNPEFRAISPNGKIPVLVDNEPSDGGEPLIVFDSGAILMYLAERSGRFLPTETRQRAQTLQWLFWQASGLSPFSGQAIHFQRYAPEVTREYGQLRYEGEVKRLYGVLDTHLKDREFIAGDYSIADIGCHAWVEMYDRFEWDLRDWPDLNRWWKAIARRPQVMEAYKRVNDARTAGPAGEDDFKKNMFGEAAAKLMPAPKIHVPQPKNLNDESE